MSEEAAPENGHETSEMRLHRQLISLARFSRSRLQRSTMLQQLEEQVTSDADVRLCIATYKDLKASSRYSYEALADLWMSAIGAALVSENDETSILLDLFQGLVFLLESAQAVPKLVAARARLASLEWKDSAAKREIVEYSQRTAGVSVVSVVLASALDSSVEWTVKVLLPWTVVAWPSVAQLSLVQALGVTAEDWAESIAPTLALKVKSHPDKAWSVVQGWIAAVGADDPSDDWCELVTKAMQHATNETLRQTAQEVCVLWAASPTLASRLLSSTPVLGPVRADVYQTITRMGQSLQAARPDLLPKLAVEILPVLAETWWKKETKTELKRACLEAGFSFVTTDAAEAKTMSAWWSAVTKKATDAGLVLHVTMAACMEKSEVVKSVVMGLAAQEGVPKAWQALVELAASKKAVHLEGLLAMYATILNAQATGKKVPSWLIKVVSLGSSKVSAATDKKGQPPFLFQESFWEGTLASSEVGAAALVHSLDLYTTLTDDVAIWSSGNTCASQAVAYAMLFPGCESKALKDAVTSLAANHPSATTSLVSAALQVVDQFSLRVGASYRETNATRQAREMESSTTISHIPTYAVLRKMVPAWIQSSFKTNRLVQALILMHMGTCKRSTGRQRHLLVRGTHRALESALSGVADREACAADFGQEILRWITSCVPKDDKTEVAMSSSGVYKASLSLLTSLVSVASQFSPDTDDPEDEDLQTAFFAQTLCTKYLAQRLAEQLQIYLSEIESLTHKDIDVYLSPAGAFVRDDDDSRTAGRKGVARKHLTEEEQWEMQIKKELSQKKGESVDETLSSEDQAKLKEQDGQRLQLRDLLDGRYRRTLEGIGTMAFADIEVGNSCLPTFGKPVLQLAVSGCPALERLIFLARRGYALLADLATCVYEIDEGHSFTIAQALRIACRRKSRPTEVFGSTGDTRPSLVMEPLPSPCPAASKVFQVMDELQDVLSGASFVFLFPMFQASLMGPRTSPGCESCVRILGLHTDLLSDEDADENVQSIRKDMIISLLALLQHDRYQTFQHPSVIDVLLDCFTAGAEGAGTLVASDLTPLLDQNGALGPKTCRIGSMKALNRVAEDHHRLVKNNPLVENRIWLNCFADDDEIQSAARQAWKTIQNASSDEKLPAPSPIYAASLTPLLNSSDDSIALAAAVSYAHAMGYHPKSVGRNVENLCKLFIGSYPSESSEADDNGSVSSSSTKTAILPSAKPAKRIISTGLPKKKAGPKKSALAIAGISKPKAGSKKKSLSSGAAAALLKPKQERTLDRESLESQFAAVPSKSQGEKDTQAKVSVRLGALRTMSSLTSADANVEIDEDALKQLTGFLMAYGLADTDETVKSAARDTLREVVATKGGSETAIAFLLPQLENVLMHGKADETSLKSLPTEKVARDVSASDRRKEGAVVALGSVALHLKGPENESKIDGTVDMLLSALKTPSENVQSSVADALTKLMKKGNTQARLETIISNLLSDCLYGETLAVRRGAAYGLSAAVKGGGIASLKKFDVVKKLEESCESGGANSKEGSLFAMELLSSRLGLLFEPYVIVLLPSLLKSFSDGNDYVRKAAAHTAGLIMSKLSAHGVKLVMPAVLESFGESAWRTKQASIQMLGSMSHLAPKQLASALPKVVPRLIDAFSDTHPKVKASAQEALHEISTVIRNPEIKSVSPMLLKALTDPADNTQNALEGLIATEFLHAIDAPSLALIVPILHRGLRDRGASVKRMGGLIAGNICTMINDPRDFLPYLPTLLPDLQTALLDPIPDVRNTSAKALGTLARSLGSHILPELRPWLVHKLRDQQCSSAERSGAAQGLTEVLIASGTEMVDDVMRSELLPLSSYPEASTREGVLWMITFLPPAMGQGFTPLIDVSLAPLVKGLSDDNEAVRDVAMRAGRVLIRSHGKVHVDKILPSLEQGLEDDDYRIRLASLSLLGDLLSTIGGTTVIRGDGDTQDDIRKAEKAQAQIALVLGPETRRRILSRLYMARSDTMHDVRQSGIQVWKTVVSVTARTLRDILAVLVNLIVENLASGHEERTLVAGQCLGDVVSKLGESVLPQIIPVLRTSLYEGDEHTKRGVCVGLTDVIKSSSKEQILRFLEIIVKLVQDALSDDDEQVRAMASSSFQSLYSLVGSRAFDEIVPSLMVSLENDDDEHAQRRALNGLTGILTVRSRELLPYIIPRLVSRPITANHARALAGIARVTGGTIHYHFSSIIPALLFDLSEGEDGDGRVDAVRDCTRAVCASVDTVGVNTLISEIASKCGSDKPSVRRESCFLFQTTITERAGAQDFFEQVPTILRELIYRLNDEDATVLKATSAAFTALSKHVDAEELVKHIEFMRNLLASMVSDARRRKGGVGDGEFLMPGFNLPKGLDPLLPIYQRGILYGSPSIREVSASGLGEVLNLTSSKYLAGPLIVKMTGPLLRIVGDRNPSSVKIAILKTLGLILVKGGPVLRAFVPQFQTTFVKALSDPSRQVRVEAIHALSLLMPLSTRVDPLIKELVSGSLGKTLTVEGPAQAAVQTATLEALAQVLNKGGTKAKLPASIPSAMEAAKELAMESSEPTIRQAAAKVLGAAYTLLGAAPTEEFLRQVVLAPEEDSEDAKRRHGMACAIRRIFAAPIGKELAFLVPELQKQVEETYWEDESSAVREAAFVAWGALVGQASDATARVKASESLLLPLLRDTRQPLEIHRALGMGLATALSLWEPSVRVERLGVRLLDASVQLALQGSQRVQFAFNDVLWIALDVGSGTTDSLDEYCNLTVFDNQRSVKSVHAKVLVKMKEITLLD